MNIRYAYMNIRLHTCRDPPAVPQSTKSVTNYYYYYYYYYCCCCCCCCCYHY